MDPARASYETRHAGGEALGTHRHHGAYLALVLDGGHVEASIDGPVDCQPGTLLLHPRFHAHGNRFAAPGARVLNRPLPDALAPDRLVALRVPDLREARAVLRSGHQGAVRALLTACEAVAQTPDGWQAALVEALCESDEPIARLAMRLGVSSAYASRAMQRSHGMGPQALRRELRWRRALTLLRGDAPLADVATGAGFSDQSHFSRIALAHSGLTPARLRTQVKSVQDASRGDMG